MHQPHPAAVVPTNRLASRSASLIIGSCAAGRPTVVLYGAAVDAADITIELQSRDPELLADDGPVAFVHHAGGAAALQAAAERTGEHGDTPPGLLIVHPLGRPGTGRGSGCDEIAAGGRRTPAWSSTACLFGSINAATTGLPELARHPVLTVDDIELRTDHAEGRLLALDLLLNMLDEPAVIHQLAASSPVAKLDRAAVDHLVGLRLAALRPAPDLTRPLVTVPGTAEEIRTALLATDGQLDELLRCAREFRCREIIVEDPRFEPLAWLPLRPRPSSLAELMTEGRLARLVGQLEPGTPALVRLGTPSAGQRVLMRIGAERVLGFVSVAGLAPDEVESASEWLRQAAPLLAAEMTRRRSRERLRTESRGQLITLLAHGLLSPPSARRALEALVGTGPARVAALSPDSPYGAGHGPARADPIPITDQLDRLRVPYGEFQGHPVLLLPDGEEVADDLATKVAHLPIAIGLGSLAEGPGEMRTSARQATWSCRMAVATRRRLLDFNDIGIHRLFLPGAEGGDRGFEQPIETLERLEEQLGFDGVGTLTSYLDTGGNMRRAADQMAIHVNTLRYRLGRIGTVIDVDITDPEQRFRLQLAVRLRAGRRALRDSRVAPYPRPTGSA